MQPGHEATKIAHLIPQYCIGKGLDLGCGNSKCFPAMVGVDNGGTYGRGGVDIIDDITKLEMFAPNSLGYIFSSHALEDLEDTKGALKVWWSKIKPGGSLLLYLPHRDLYPNVGQEGANPAHKHDFMPGDITEIMREIANESGEWWVQLEDETRSLGTEYSFYQVYRKTTQTHCERRIFERNPGGKKRALVVRYGAIGDQIVAASILPGLKAKGYHVTYNTTPVSALVIRHDPHIDEFFLQEKDFVPNGELGPYWHALEERYDFIVNLCESVEGRFLALPGRLEHRWSHEVRAKLLNKNYLEHTHDLADAPYEFSNARFHSTKEERAEMRALRKTMSGPVVYWATSGSSPHKIYPFADTVMAWLLEKTDAHIVITADPLMGKVFQDAIIEKLDKLGLDTKRVHGMAGKWSVRQSLAFNEVANVVVGPETGILNGAGMLPCRKVVMLSHSSKENLTKHWKNTESLLANVPCMSCHLMHYNWDHCHVVEETSAALCASNIQPERLFAAIMFGIQELPKAS
jgi:ADP-heptose:LPS heptosyltransferase/predicted SAM-dependent methyltransferase